MRLLLSLCTILLPIIIHARPSPVAPGTQFKFAEKADIFVTHRNINEDLTEDETTIKLTGTFSPVGSNYETGGDIVQVSSFRACDARRKGLDHTVFGHVSVVFVDDVQPFLTGCVALDNQARFAEKSGAMAVVVGPASRVEKTTRPMTIGGSKIPIIVLDDEQTERLRGELKTASLRGAVAKLRIGFIDEKTSASKVLKLQVFRPTLLNISLLGLLIILIIFVSLLVVIKIRCQPTMHRELWLRALARTALSKMEIRSFHQKEKKKTGTFARLKHHRTMASAPSSRHSSYLAVFGSLTSVAQSSSSQSHSAAERCVICLEEYEEGTELRVLFCGHEFHPKCVDPWLLSRRRCPLCQYDVVYKHYPKVDSPEKSSGLPSDDITALLPRPSPEDRQLPRITTTTIPSSSRPSRSSRNRPVHPYPRGSQPVSNVTGAPRTRSCPRRRQLRSRNQIETAIRIGGYSSDVSSSHADHPRSYDLEPRTTQQL